MDETRQLREEAAVCDFVSQFLADRDRGAPRELADYLACFPEFAERIASEHRALLAGTTTPSAVPLAAGRDVGPYRLVERLGHGGQGVVFRAEHRELQRTVALKMLHQGVLGLSAAHRARLRREAITVARLDHPGICPVYEVELDGPEPYLAMRYVPGQSLATELDQARQARGHRGLPPHTREAIDAWLSFFERAALALHAAHVVGIVHRDVKPHNLMRTPDGAPVLLDFGLARDVRSTSAALTRSHELFGTLAYMAPELLTGKAEPNPRHDVYALGVSLYETVTLQQPFAAATPEALWKRIESGSVTAVHEHNRHLPKDLDVVVATALERDPARRYPTAQALAEDLRRVRLGEPILARRLGRIVRARRWVRRHPVFSVAFTLLVLGFAVAVALLLEVARSRAATERANVDLQRSNQDLTTANRELQAVRDANLALFSSDVKPTRALVAAVGAARRATNSEIAGILLQILERSSSESEVLLRQTHDSANSCEALAVDHRGEFVAVPMRSGEVLVVEVRTGGIVQRIAGGPPGLTYAAFRGQTQELLTAGVDGVLRAWQIGMAAPLREWSARAQTDAAQRTSALAVSDDGRLVARGDVAGHIDLLDCSGDGPRLSCLGHTKNVSFATFGPGGRGLLTLSREMWTDRAGDNSVRIFDTVTGAQAGVFEAGLPVAPGVVLAAPTHAAWSADRTRLAIAREQGGVLLLQPGNPDNLGTFVLSEGKVSWVAFDPVRPRLLLGGQMGLVAYDYEQRRIVGSHADFGDRGVTQVLFTAAGDRVAVLANDATCRIYDAATLGRIRTLRPDFRPSALCWAAGDTRLVALGSTTLTILFAKGRPFLPECVGHSDRVLQVHFDRSGAQVVAASRDHTARVWSACDGEPRAVLAHAGPVRTARFSECGDRVVTTSETDAARIWSLGVAADGTPATATTGAFRSVASGPASDAWFCDVDRRVVTIDDEGWLRGYDAHTGVPLFAEHLHETKIESSAWHPSRPWLATGAGGRVVSVYDCVRQQEVFRSSPWPWSGTEATGRRVFALTFSLDGESLFGAGEDLRLHRWPLVAGQGAWTSRSGPTYGALVSTAVDELLAAGRYSPICSRLSARDGGTLEYPNTEVGNVVSSLRRDAAGRRVMWADKSGRVAVFELDPWREVLTFRASEVPLLDAEFSPDGQSIVTGDANGRVRIWPVDPLQVAERYLPREPGTDGR